MSGARGRHAGDGAGVGITVLARALREFRLASGLSREQMAKRLQIPLSQLITVEQGRTTVSRDVLHAYLEVADQPTWTRLMKLWKTTNQPDDGPEAEIVQQILSTVQQQGTLAPFNESLSKPAWRRSVAVSRANPALWPSPDLITTIPEFIEALECIKKSTGMSYKNLAKASEREGHPLSSSLIHSMCTKKPPGNAQVLRCFIKICNGATADADRWAQAWQRLVQNTELVDEPSTPAPEYLDVDYSTAPSKRMVFGVREVVAVAVSSFALGAGITGLLFVAGVLR